MAICYLCYMGLLKWLIIQEQRFKTTKVEKHRPMDKKAILNQTAYELKREMKESSRVGDKTGNSAFVVCGVSQYC